MASTVTEKLQYLALDVVTRFFFSNYALKVTRGKKRTRSLQPKMDI